MNDPSSTQGGPNLGNLLVGDTARIEVLRGAQSTLWGSQAIGGVINIVTAEPSETFGGRLEAEAGSRGTRYLRGAVGGRHDRLSWRLAANRYDTDGFSAYAPGNEKDGYTNTTVSGRANVAITNDISLDFRAVHSDGTSQFDGWGRDSREYGDTKELVAYAGLNADLLGGRFRNRLGYAVTDTQRTNYDPDRRIETGTFEANGENTRWDYQGIFAFTDDLNATFGIESERSEMRTRSLVDGVAQPDFIKGDADQDSAYAQLQWAAIPGLNLTAGIRHDDHDRYGSDTTGQIAAAWSLHDGKTVIRAAWGQGFRAPGLYELYSEYGNLGLEPERFDSWEIGVQQQLFEKATITATYFERTGDNEIRYNGCSFGTTDPLCFVKGQQRWGYYTNVLSTEARGVEVSGRIELSPSLTLSGNYTWTDAVNGDGPNRGKRLTRRPEHMGNLSADYAFSNGLKTGLAVRYAGEAFTNDGNSAWLDDYTLVDLRISYAVTPEVELYGRVENLFDEQYQLVPDYGTAGRGAFAGVRLKF